MDIECNLIWRNDQYDVLFDELKETYDSLAMEIPRKDLKKLPPEWLTSKVTFDPAYATIFYSDIENSKWTSACIQDEWLLLEIDYEQFKELRKLSLEQENIEIDELKELLDEQEKQGDQTLPSESE